MKTVKLYGAMGKRFGRVFRLDVATPAEAIRALINIRPGFRRYLHDHGGDQFQVIVGSQSVDADGLVAPCGSSEVIKFVPVVAGAKDGFGQFVTGVLMIVAAYYLGPAGAGLFSAGMVSAVTSMGYAMAIGGVAQMLAGSPDGAFNPSSTTSDIDTFTFNSPTLTTGQGGSVPLLYGKHRVGGHVVSAGIDTQTWQPKGFGGAAPDEVGTLGGNGDTSPWVWAIAP